VLSTGTMSAARWPAIALPPLRRPGLLHLIVCWGITDTVQVLVVDVRYNHDHRAIGEIGVSWASRLEDVDVACVIVDVSPSC